MQQSYHSNATTNQHIRAMIQSSELTSKELSLRYNIDVKTSEKWRVRNFQEDVSSRPHNINYALTELEKDIIASIRRLTWSSLDDLTETIQINFPHAKRSAIYEALKSRCINTIPIEKKKEAAKFKEYDPENYIILLTLSPCKMCTKILVNAGFKHVYWIDDYRNLEHLAIFNHCNITNGPILNLVNDYHLIKD